MSTSKRLVLASGSPRRSELLRSIGVEISVHPVDVDETFEVNNPVEEEAKRLSGKKALAAAKAFPDRFVLAADTIVAQGETLLAKPADEVEAMDMLRKLQGSVHKVVTGCAIVCESLGHHDLFYVCTEVTFKTCSDDELLAYCRTGEPFDKAGAYGIQGQGAFLVAEISGSYTNVVGLPLAQVADKLQQLKIWSPADLVPGND